MPRTSVFTRALRAPPILLALMTGCGSASPAPRLQAHAQSVLERHIAEARRAMGLGDQAGTRNALTALGEDLQALAARHTADRAQLALLRLEVGQASARVALDVHPTLATPSPVPATIPTAPAPPAAVGGASAAHGPRLGTGLGPGNGDKLGHGDKHRGKHGGGGSGKDGGGGGGGGGD